MELLLGDEAVALAAVYSGIGGAFSYPGTPATEILEYVRDHAGRCVVAEWSTNEKVAYEQALGMSYAGKRALVSMKHVGLNVAADPLMSSALTGAHAGLVVAVADDPGMHSSQNEQDSRYYGQFAKIPVLEPADHQEAYDMTLQAFELSETMNIPVLIRLVTRLAHSRGLVAPRRAVETRPLGRALDRRSWILLPVNARRNFRRLLDLQGALQDHSRCCGRNRLELRGPLGVIACGIAYNYLREALGPQVSHSILKIGMYPIPGDLVRQLRNHCNKLTVLEEGYPLVEAQLNGLLGAGRTDVQGRLTGALPPDGALDTDQVRAALGLRTVPGPSAFVDLPTRPPQFCAGCPHTDTFKAITAALQGGPQAYLFSDIGCYTLGAYPPYEAIDTCVDMGASIGMGLGAAKAGAHPIVCTIGDSTFIHSGLGGLIEAVRLQANMTVVILDNATVAMTGGQDVLVSGKELRRLLLGCGVNHRHLLVIRPLARDHDRNIQVLRQEIAHRGLSVIVSSRPCVQTKRRTSKGVGAVTVFDN